MLYYLNLFYFYSFLGFLLELFLKTFVFQSMNSGILYGPWLPVYGFGGVFVILVEKWLFKRRKISKVWRVILTFLILTILLSVIEYLGGALIEAVFHRTFWDYRYMRFNIGKYNSLEMSFIWGICSLIIIYVIQPFCEMFIKKIPVLITVFLSILFVVDFVMTFLIH